jgi:hypothetical protein
MFEDDDYAVRPGREGTLVCAEDVFVPLRGVSLGSLLTSGSSKLLNANREAFRHKWGIDWQPIGIVRAGLPAADRGIRQVVGRSSPGATVLVISKGDPDLLDLEGGTPARRGLAPCRPPSGQELRRDRPPGLFASRRGPYLIPGPALWWLEHYAEFRDTRRHRRRVPRDRPVRDLPLSRLTSRLIIDSIEFIHHRPSNFCP